MSEQVNERAVTQGALPAFPAFLLERQLVNRQDLAIAEEYAVRERADLVDAVVTLGLVQETDSYAALALAAGTDFVDLVQTPSSELAIRLLPERLARRHLVVPLTVDNRTLTFATCRPFSPEAERDVAFASGRRTQMVDGDPLGHRRRARSLLPQAARARRARRAPPVGAAGRRERRSEGCADGVGLHRDRALRSPDRTRGRSGRQRRARRVRQLRHARALPHLRRPRAGADAAGLGLSAGPQPLQDHGEGGHLGPAPPAGWRVPAESERPPDRHPALEPADGRRREARHARHRQPQHAADARSPGLRRRHAGAVRAGAGASRRPGPGDGTDRVRQDDRALRRARPSPDGPDQHRERRGSGRADGHRRHADSGEREGRQHVSELPPIAPPAGSERHHGRRDPRRRGRADRGTGGLHRPPGPVVDAHRRHRHRHHASDEPGPRAVQDRRVPVGGPVAAPAALALPALPARAPRHRGAPPRHRASRELGAGVGRAGLRALQADGLRRPRAGDRAADAVRRAARRDRPGRHGARDPRRDARRRVPDHARTGAAAGG